MDFYEVKGQRKTRDIPNWKGKRLEERGDLPNKRIIKGLEEDT